MSILTIALCILGYFLAGLIILMTDVLSLKKEEVSWETRYDVQDLALYVLLWPIIPLFCVCYYIVTGFGYVVRWLLKKLTK